MKRYITYYRVSTQEQGESGLGIQAQRSAVRQFLKARNGEEIDSFTEIESGGKNDRPILKEAVNRCKDTDAKLLVAKLDRLSRNAKFLYTLKEELEGAGIGFTIADLPEANTLTIGIMAALAQHERELISKRTKEALQALKEQGVELGNPENLTDEAREKAWATISKNARTDTNTRKAFHFIQPRREKGLSYAKIAEALNEEGYRTREGKKFHPAQVRKIWLRFTVDG